MKQYPTFMRNINFIQWTHAQWLCDCYDWNRVSPILHTHTQTHTLHTVYMLHLRSHTCTVLSIHVLYCTLYQHYIHIVTRPSTYGVYIYTDRHIKYCTCICTHTHIIHIKYPFTYSHTLSCLHYIMSFNYCLVTTVTWLLDCKLLMINLIIPDTLYTLHWYMFLWLYCESLNEIIIII